LSEETYRTCDWLGCGEAISADSAEATKWGYGSLQTYADLERNAPASEFDLCPEHNEKLQDLVAAPVPEDDQS
jgi:hypothetical protein